MRKSNLIFGSSLLVLLLTSLSAQAQVQQDWAVTYDGASVQPDQPDYDQVRAIAVDGAGRVHVTGQSYGSNGTVNIVTIQYSPEGRPLWTASYDAARDSDYPWAMVLDDSGNIYITGTSYGLMTGADIVTLKYDSSGNLLWAARYDGRVRSSDSGNAVRVDRTGHVYVTGYSYNALGDFDIVTIKYDAQGRELWVARYDGPGGGEDRGQGLVLDAQGNAYVTGFSVSNCFLEPNNDEVCRLDGITIKYSPDGQELWVDRYDSGAGLNDSFNAIALDPTGHPIVTGFSSPLENVFEFITIKYSADGRRLWQAREPDPGPIFGGGWDISTDAQGNVFVLGIGMQTLKYDRRGRLLWAAQASRFGTALGVGLVVDAAGNAVIAGSTFSDDAPLDATVVKYDPCGNVLWSYAYNAGPGANDAAYALALDAAGHVYVGGETRADSLNPFSTPDFFTFKLTQDEALVSPQVTLRTQTAFTFEAAGRANSPAAFVVTRSGGTNVALTVHYASSGTARNGVDYAALSGTVTIPAGQTKASILIRAIDDKKREGLETVILELSPDAAYRLCGKRIAAAYIIDDDLKLPPPAGRK